MRRKHETKLQLISRVLRGRADSAWSYSRGHKRSVFGGAGGLIALLSSIFAIRRRRHNRQQVGTGSYMPST